MPEPIAQERSGARVLNLPRPAPLSTLGVREILFPSDLSPASDRALDHARLLAEWLGARLALYHVVEIAGFEQPADLGPTEAERWRRAQLDATAHLELNMAGFDVPRTILVEPARSSPKALIRHVRTLRPDLIVMATHGRDGLALALKGSTTEAVLDHCFGPTLCVREPAHGMALPYRRILVPTDLSPESRRALPIAALLARAFNAEVCALHVAKSPKVEIMIGIPGLVERSVPSEAALLRFTEPELTGVRVTARVETGASPWEAILSVARDERADVIVLSTHGHQRLADRLRGTHAERIVREAPCPVLVA